MSCALLALFSLFFVSRISADSYCSFDSSFCIAGYIPESNVYNHILIDLDQADLVTFVDAAGWASAKNIYENGEHSVKASGVVRNFKGFSVNGCKQKGEHYFDIYNKYWVSKGLTDCQYADDIMQAAFDGTQVSSTGFEFSGAVTGSDAFRSQAIKKGVLYLNVFMYTIWEMQDAINNCSHVCRDDAGMMCSCTQYECVSVYTSDDTEWKAWDEAVAFYTGSLEGTERGGVNGLDSGTAQMMFTLAEKRCKDFGTCTADYDENPIAGYSEVNNAIFMQFEMMKAWIIPSSISSARHCDAERRATWYIGKDEIVRLMIVPMLQGVLRYLYETDSRVEPGGATDKEVGDLWAFVTGILPMIHEADPNVAADLYTYTWGQDTSNDNFTSLKTKLESTYDKLGIKCEDIGALCDKSITTSCTPYTFGEMSYDTRACSEEFAAIAGYEPESDVHSHSRIDLDQADLVEYVGDADWTSAKDIYENGRYSIEYDDIYDDNRPTHTFDFQEFSVNDCKQKGEHYFDIHNNYWVSKGLTDCQYADDIMQAAFDGAAVSSTGFSFSGDVTGSDDFRSQAIKKGVLYLNVFMYTIWEMQDAINDCNWETYGDPYATGDPSGYPSAWDEAVAFYTGSAEGTERGGMNGLDSGAAHMMFTLAEKRCKNFGTCTGDYDNNPIAGYSAINEQIFEEFETAKDYLRPTATRNYGQPNPCEDAYISKDKIVKKMLVPMLQGVFRYLYETDSRIEPNGASNKELGKLWAFVTGVLPMIHEANAMVAADLYTYTWGQDTSNDNFSSLKTKIESTYDALGITCEDIGTLCDESITTSCTAYTDGEVSYDTSVCTSTSSEDESASKNDGNDDSAVKYIIIVVCIVLAVSLMVAIFYAYSQRKKDHEFVETTTMEMA